MSSAFPSFHFHPSSPNTAASSSPQQAVAPAAKLLANGGGGRVVRPATPASSSPIHKKTTTAAVAGRASQAKRLVLGSLHPNSFVAARHAHAAGQRKAQTKVVSGYATPTSSSPVRPATRDSRQQHASSDDATPSSPVAPRNDKVLSLSAAELASSSPLPSLGAPTDASPVSPSLSQPPPPTTSTRPSSSSKPDEVLHAPLPLSMTHTFLLGRTRSAHPLAPKPFRQIPPDVVHALRKPYNAILRLPLPRSATHASRVHVVVELVRPDLARVLVLGQNGARVNGRRIAAGQTVVVDAAERGEVRAEGADGGVLKAGRKDAGAASGGLRIGFWGVEVVLQWPVVEKRAAVDAQAADVALSSDAEKTESEVRSSSSDDDDRSDDMDVDTDDENAYLSVSRPPSSMLPPSSPPPALSLSSSPQRRPVLAGTPSLSPSSSLADRSSPPRPTLASSKPVLFSRPAAPAEPIRTVVPPAPPKPTKPSMPPPSFKPEPKEAPVPTAPRPPPKPTRPAPDGVDLPSLLSSALVFSHVTSLAVPDLVRAVLETSPSLKEQGTTDEWEAWVFEEVNKGGMWGRVIRRGKVRGLVVFRSGFSLNRR